MLKKIEFFGIDVSPINFTAGINIILGNKENSDDSYNSLGKTMLINIINHLYGASNKGKFNYIELEGVFVSGEFLLADKTVTIKRKLYNEKKSVSEKIEIIRNDFSILNSGKVGDVTLKVWLNFLTEIYLEKNTFSFREYNNMFFKMNNLKDFENSLKPFSANGKWEKSKFQSYLLKIGYDIVKDNKMLTTKEKGVLKKIAPILNEDIKENTDLITMINIKEKDYFKINDKLLKLNKERRNYTRKIRQLNKNIAEIKSRNSDMFALNFNIYKTELSTFLKKNFEQTKKFHKKLLNDNQLIIMKELERLNIELEQLEESISNETRIKKNIENKMKDLETTSASPVVLKYLLSQNFQEANISKVVNDSEKRIHFKQKELLEECIEINEKKVLEYKEYLLSIVQYVYHDIQSIDFHIFATDSGYLDLSFEFVGSSGEGKGTLRTLIYILLILKVNNCIQDYLILDSTAFDAVDVDDFNRFLLYIEQDNYLKKLQFIIAGNTQNFAVEQNFFTAIELTPQSNLFNMKLTEMPI